jgi:hypothetical protein
LLRRMRRHNESSESRRRKASAANRRTALAKASRGATVCRLQVYKRTKSPQRVPLRRNREVTRRSCSVNRGTAVASMISWCWQRHSCKNETGRHAQRARATAYAGADWGGGGRGRGGTGNRAETKAEVRRWRCRLARVEGEEGAGVKVEKLRMLGKSRGR